MKNLFQTAAALTVATALSGPAGPALAKQSMPDYAELNRALEPPKPAPSLRKCMIEAVIDTAQNPAARYHEESLYVDPEDGQDVLRIGGVQTIGREFQAGAAFFLKPDSLTVLYGYKYLGKVKVAGERDTVTALKLDIEGFTGYTAIDSESGAKATKHTKKTIHDNALTAAGQFLTCMRPVRLPIITLQ